MADYHFVYKDVEGASTQWDDIQRKLGNLPPKPPPFEPAPDPDSACKDKSWIDQKTEEELEDLEDDLDGDRFLEDYRKKRLAEMRQAAKVSKYGSVMQISGSDFVREVSQAPQDVWVVVLLYKEGFPECGLLLGCLEELAVKYPATNGAVKANYVGLYSFGRRCTSEVWMTNLKKPFLKEFECGLSKRLLPSTKIGMMEDHQVTRFSVRSLSLCS
ncbi:hypothetical protein V6N13_120712 [Hibiscus sabdariffa]|uniref:Phosducin domain-containing protein n=1 Tax=Hibiscus sabdariffa TaxID=183260 RepID=A0ABR2E535_9ROSI